MNAVITKRENLIQHHSGYFSNMGLESGLSSSSALRLKSINGLLTSFTLSSFVDILEHWLQLTPGLRQQSHLIIQSRMNVNEDSGVKKKEHKV